MQKQKSVVSTKVSNNTLKNATKLAQRQSLLEDINLIQVKAQNFEVSHEELTSFVQEAQKFLEEHPSDTVNLMESQQLQFDIMEQFRNLGNQILSMFKMKNSGETSSDDYDASTDKDDDNEEI